AKPPSAIQSKEIDMNPVSLPAPQEPWYKYGVAILVLEMAIAITVSAYSLYMTFNGLGGFPGKH
ncbi:MAG: hypothetical protein WAU57_11150, partial [Xanthobacteraceae bacterium]